MRLLPKLIMKNQPEPYITNKSKFMKPVFTNFLAAAVMLAVSCGGPKNELAEKKEKLKDLRTKEASLGLEIKKLEEEIAQSDKGGLSKKLLLVETDTLTPASFAHSIEVYGTVDSDENVQVAPETNGIIRTIKVHEGSHVKKGQLLATLDMDVLTKSIKEVENSLELASTIYAKQKKLWDQKIGTEVQYLEARNRKESLEMKLNTLKSQLAMGYVRAPIDGLVDEVFQKQGEMASPAMPILRLVNSGSSEITADLSESYLGSVKKGDNVLVQIPTLKEKTEGTISSVSEYINPANRTFRVNVNVGKKSGALKPNMLTRISIKDYKANDALVVPSDVIQYDQKGNFVFTINGAKNKSVAEKTYVETGLSDKGMTVLKSGIQPGEVVVVKGQRALTDGEEIRIKRN